jgi:hypothetical protein
MIMACCSNQGSSGSFAEGRKTGEFVYQAHGGTLRNQTFRAVAWLLHARDTTSLLS